MNSVLKQLLVQSRRSSLGQKSQLGLFVAFNAWRPVREQSLAEQSALGEETMADPEAGKRTAEFFKAVNEYRKHPMLNNNLKRSTPGLGIAVIAFGVYLFVDGMASKLGKGGHDSEH